MSAALFAASTPAAGWPQIGATSEDCGFDFVDVAAEAGLSFVHESGASGGLHLPETMGAGTAWIDFDGDGWMDVYLVQSGPFPPQGGQSSADRLFRNLGPEAAGNFRFEPVETGTLPRGYGQGVVAADIDGDRDVDLLVSHYGPTVLLRNLGDGAFAVPEPLPAASPEAGADAFPWGSSMALADGDGDLDLYVSRYVDYDPEHGLVCRRDGPDSGRQVCDPSLFLGQHDRYYLNRGGGVFEDATAPAGLGGAHGKGLGVVFTDLDGDGMADLYVANDLTLNLLFRNRGDGTYEDQSLLSGAAVNGHGRPEAGMGLAVADFDLDGDPDLAVTNFDVETNTLYRNDSTAAGHQFEDTSAVSGFGLPSFNLLGFGIVAEDLDRDGSLDVYVGNGHIFSTPSRDNTSYRQRNLLLRGAGTGSFAEVRCDWTDRDPLVSRGVALGDFDNDGDGDLLVTANDGPVRLWRNDAAAPRGGWLAVELRGSARNTQGVGAAVTLVPAAGTRPERRWVLRGDSYQSSSDHRLRWAAASSGRGITAGGAGDGGILRLDVHWPSGDRTRIVDPPRGVYLIVQEGR
ncbi:MAG: CRTAC1 family protein [Acidobacteria bacterium]|nr:CRTAC1 family protein [Acidobacteriota bacterium]